MRTPVIHSVPDAFGVYCVTTIPKNGPWHPDTRLTDAEYAAATAVVDYDGADADDARSSYFRHRSG